MNALRVAALALAALLAVPAANATELRLLSAGAVELGLMPALADFERESGHAVRVEFAAAPALAGRFQTPPGYDAVIASVMKHLLASSRPGEFGLGAITEIVLVKDQGLKLVGPLPAGAQNYTSYLASAAAPPGADAARSTAAAALLRFLDSPKARRIFADVGIEAATP